MLAISIAAALMVSFAAPAFAEEIYVVFDPASHKCEAMHNIPDGMKSMGKYGSMDEPIAGPFLFHEAGASSLIRPPTLAASASYLVRPLCFTSRSTRSS